MVLVGQPLHRLVASAHHLAYHAAQFEPLNMTVVKPNYAIPTEALDLIPLDADRYPDAVCNDGSQSGFYFKMAEDPRRSFTWLVYLEGGGWCGGKYDCMHRCQPDMTYPWCSSKHWEPKMYTTSGLLVQDEIEELRGANKVYVKHCTSDAYMGNARAFGMEFRGSRVIEAVFQELRDRMGLGQGGENLVVMAGESAGARGAMVNIDYIHDFLGETPGKVRVVGFLDSPLWIDIPPMHSAPFIGFRKSCRQVVNFANVTRFGKECAASFPPAQRFKCIMGEYRLKTLRAPFFMVAASYDSFQLYNNLGHDPMSDEDLEYIERFRKRTETWASAFFMVDRESKGAVRQNGIFVPACYTHARSAMVYGITTDMTNGFRIADQFAAFLGNVLNDTEWSRLELDMCEGFACGEGCPDIDPVTLGLLDSRAPERAAWPRSLAAAGSVWALLLAMW